LAEVIWVEELRDSRHNQQKHTSRASAQAFSPFPPTSDRLKALHQEIADLLPKQDGQVVSTPEFEEFKERLRNWKSEGPLPTQTGEKPAPHDW
jgi:hypothetical protein